ncbi:hypothetical protein FQN60_011799 [Etheostoma spectabile]|uniref:Uncharacterized protein n=1 Tax=Etheostoma spectabile TaxID=54343 RepID=A0A5J5DMM4_9PERO|nr:hypothetical protein FQN60_011799 [Etheostoma spectabile]
MVRENNNCETASVPVHVFLDLSTLECRHLSDSVELFVLDLMDSTANYTNREVTEISVSTLSQNSHWKQAAVVLQQPLEVRAGDRVHLAVKLHKSAISISAHIENTPRQMEQ